VLRRHRQQRVGRQQRQDAVEVDGRPRVLEAPHDIRLRVSVRRAVGARERAFLMLAREATACALERAVDGGHAVAEHIRRLPSGPVEHVAHDEHDALLGREQLHGGDEREPDGLGRLERGCGLGRAGRGGLRVGFQVRVQR
jgi:hypothetical protein